MQLFDYEIAGYAATNLGTSSSNVPACVPDGTREHKELGQGGDL